MKRARTISIWIFCALLSLCAGGCYFGERYLAQEPFNEQAMAGIKQRTITRQEVLEWFGPPVAFARRGTVVTFPPPGMRNEGWEEIQSDTFFELFPSQPGNADDQVIYYYYSSRLKTDGVVSILIAGGYTRRLVVDQLWLLINERTGRVEDFVLRTGKKETPTAAPVEPQLLLQGRGQ